MLLDIVFLIKKYFEKILIEPGFSDKVLDGTEITERDWSEE